MLLIDKGRDIDERAVVFIEKGLFRGIAFINLNYQITNTDVLQSLLTPMQDNRDAQHIIQSSLRKNKMLKMISFS